MRPGSRLPPDLSFDTVLDLRDFRDKLYATTERNALMTIKLYLELPESPHRPQSDISSNSILLFFKLYNPIKSQLTYISHLCVWKCERFHSIFASVAKMVDLERIDIVGYGENQA